MARGDTPELDADEEAKAALAAPVMPPPPVFAPHAQPSKGKSKPKKCVRETRLAYFASSRLLNSVRLSNAKGKGRAGAPARSGQTPVSELEAEAINDEPIGGEVELAAVSDTSAVLTASVVQEDLIIQQAPPPRRAVRSHNVGGPSRAAMEVSALNFPVASVTESSDSSSSGRRPLAPTVGPNDGAPSKPVVWR